MGDPPRPVCTADHSHEVVEHEEWTRRRMELLEKEKHLVRLQDELARERMALPWERVTKDYTFDGPEGSVSLADLFQPSQAPYLVVQHLMFDPAWERACSVCCVWADSFAGMYPHLLPRTNFVAIAKAPIEKLQPFAAGKGWPFKAFSCYNNDFGEDFGASFSQEAVDREAPTYNYGRHVLCRQMPGVSVFHKNERGEIFHTYSAYARGLELFSSIWGVLDSLPIGRNDKGRNAYWVRHKELYSGDGSVSSVPAHPEAPQPTV